MHSNLHRYAICSKSSWRTVGGRDEINLETTMGFEPLTLITVNPYSSAVRKLTNNFQGGIGHKSKWRKHIFSLDTTHKEANCRKQILDLLCSKIMVLIHTLQNGFYFFGSHTNSLLVYIQHC